MAWLLDLANILGGLLLAVALLRQLPRVGGGVGRFAARVAPWGWLVGVVALVAGGFYLLVHLFSGPRVFHFEVVGIAVGVALLWDRLTGRPGPTAAGPAGTADQAASGRVLLLAIFGLIAVVVGVQGLFTPN